MDDYDTAHPRGWTFMVYLAGDNDLETFGDKDLAEIQTVGSTPEVSIVAQFDRMSDQVSRRYFLTQGATLEANCVSVLPEINTGDPQSLIDFIVWACSTYPAQRYALVLWNHGTGWKDDDIYRSAHRQGVSGEITRAQVRGLASGKPRRAIFRTTLDQLVAEAAHSQRAILFDDSSADFLDSQEMRAVLLEAKLHHGRPLDLVGFDACLMNMVEVAYQVRDACHVIVGSQEIEPGDGWPYHHILQELVANPLMDSGELSQRIVRSYVSFYRNRSSELPVTQSAVRMAYVETVAQALDELGHTAQTALMEQTTRNETVGRIFASLRQSQSFSDRDYVDLVHFCQLLGCEAGENHIGRAAQQVVSLLVRGGAVVLDEDHSGAGMDNAHGLSIYLPARDLSPFYDQLEFAKASRWNDFLKAFLHGA